MTVFLDIENFGRKHFAVLLDNWVSFDIYS